MYFVLITKLKDCITNLFKMEKKKLKINRNVQVTISYSYLLKSVNNSYVHARCGNIQNIRSHEMDISAQQLHLPDYCVISNKCRNVCRSFS